MTSNGVLSLSAKQILPSAIQYLASVRWVQGEIGRPPGWKLKHPAESMKQVFSLYCWNYQECLILPYIAVVILYNKAQRWGQPVLGTWQIFKFNPRATFLSSKTLNQCLYIIATVGPMTILLSSTYNHELWVCTNQYISVLNLCSNGVRLNFQIGLEVLDEIFMAIQAVWDDE